MHVLKESNQGKEKHAKPENQISKAIKTIASNNLTGCWSGKGPASSLVSGTIFQGQLCSSNSPSGVCTRVTHGIYNDFRDDMFENCLGTVLRHPVLGSGMAQPSSAREADSICQQRLSLAQMFGTNFCTRKISGFLRSGSAQQSKVCVNVLCQ